MSVQYKEVMGHLKSMGNKKDLEGMKRFGINTEKAYGISVTSLRKFAKKIGKNHELAKQLWSSGIHEARLLSCIIEEPEKVSEDQMNNMVKDLNSWDLVDISCNEVFRKLPFAYKKCFELSSRKEEFVKRTAFSLMAYFAWNDRKISNEDLMNFFPVIKRESTDNRNFVKKAVNWALRQIGKKNKKLNKEAIKVAKEIQKIDSKAAKWITSGALKELTDKKILERLK